MILQKSRFPFIAKQEYIKPGTIRVQEHETGNLFPYFSKLKLKNITRKMYQDALNELKYQDYSNSTREGINITGRMIFRNALKLELKKGS